MGLHSAKNNVSGSLAVAVTAVATTITVDITDSAQLDSLRTASPFIPFYLSIDDEIVEVFGVSGDDDNVLDVDGGRGSQGTTAAAHSLNSTWRMNITEGVLQDLIDNMYALLHSWGGGEGVIRDGTQELDVVAQSTPDMTVLLNEGICWVNSQVFRLRTEVNSDTLVAPVTNDRIDIVEVSPWKGHLITTGTEDASPTAPTVTTGYFKIAEIYHRPAETSIEDADDSTNGYITDSRTFV